MSGSNIKGAPGALSPELVADFIAWLDRDRPPMVVMPDNAISNEPFIKAAQERGIAVQFPDPMRPESRARGERNG